MPSAARSPIKDDESNNPSTLDQRETLLSTKLFSPLVRPDHVIRPRLIAQLNAGLEKALFLISAPAGYGKTTLVTNWLNEIDIPRTWISLDDGDNDPIHFLQYLLTALNQIVPSLQTEMLTAFRGPASIETLLNTIINGIHEYSLPFVLVLDDFHVIDSQQILDFLTYLFEHIPPNLHVIMISRTDPLLPLSHWRVRNQIVEIRAEQLRFTSDEIADFLHKVLKEDLSIADLAALQARTEGWIASIQLAALSMQSCDDIHAFITAFAGSHHYIIDYLTEEVLRRLPEKTTTFLLHTSILNRMCGSLCDAVVEPGPNDRVNGQQMLEGLERNNLFLVPLDNKRHWYRYHHLFSDMLNRHLADLYPDLSPNLHRRASMWFEQVGYIPEAIDHALLAGDQDRVTALIEQNGVPFLIHGEITAVFKWIMAVEPYSQTHPWLYILKAWVFALRGELERVDGMLQKAEEVISFFGPSKDVKTLHGAITAARAYRSNLMGDAEKAADFASQALKILPEIDLIPRSLRAVSASLLGDASSLTGNLEEARRAYIESARIAQEAGDIHLNIVINSNLANILLEQGLIRQAEKIYSDTLSLAARPDGQTALIAGRLFIELSQVYYEWDQLDNAFQYAKQGLELCQKWGNIDLQAVGYAQLARIEHIFSHHDEMHAAFQAAEQLLRYDLAPRYSICVKSVLARLQIDQGNYEYASNFLKHADIDIAISSGEIPFILEPLYLILLRLDLVQRRYDHALELGNHLLRRAEAGKRTGRIIEILILQALIYYSINDIVQAITILGKAVQLAQPDGYRRVFLDEGRIMMKLLYQVKVHQTGGDFISELVPRLGVEGGQAVLSSQRLVEPLTKRELELFKLIEQGYTNQDIAEKLVISIPTVKRHISNIYSKLGAKNRTQAISLGRELDLLQ
jgi:ATP/maltotriose-dependent transcriptional regulator MalT